MLQFLFDFFFHILLNNDAVELPRTNGPLVWSQARPKITVGYHFSNHSISVYKIVLYRFYICRYALYPRIIWTFSFEHIFENIHLYIDIILFFHFDKIMPAISLIVKMRSSFSPKNFQRQNVIIRNRILFLWIFSEFRNVTLLIRTIVYFMRKSWKIFQISLWYNQNL